MKNLDLVSVEREIRFKDNRSNLMENISENLIERTTLTFMQLDVNFIWYRITFYILSMLKNIKENKDDLQERYSKY